MGKEDALIVPQIAAGYLHIPRLTDPDDPTGLKHTDTCLMLGCEFRSMLMFSSESLPRYIHRTDFQ